MRFLFGISCFAIGLITGCAVSRSVAELAALEAEEYRTRAESEKHDEAVVPEAEEGYCGA